MPMLLRGTDGQELELAVIVDRLPESQDGFGDDEAVTVSIRVVTADQEWEETAPSLGMHELHMLVQWLQSVGEQTPGESEIDLLANGINFRVIGADPKNVNLRVGFALEGRPDEFKMDAPTTEAPFVNLNVRRDDLVRAAEALRAELLDAEGQPKDDTLGAEDLGLMRGERNEERLGDADAVDESQIREKF